METVMALVQSQPQGLEFRLFSRQLVGFLSCTNICTGQQEAFESKRWASFKICKLKRNHFKAAMLLQIEMMQPILQAITKAATKARRLAKS